MSYFGLLGSAESYLYSLCSHISVYIAVTILMVDTGRRNKCSDVCSL